MPCAETLRVQAYFDGEIDAMSALEIETHLTQCAECQASLEDLQNMKELLRQDIASLHVPAPVRKRVLHALDAESGATSAAVARASKARLADPFWAGALSGLAAAAIAAGFAFLLIAHPSANDALLSDLADAHLRSMMPAHLIDVESTDKHTVKPWFSGHTDVSPAVADFADRGYRLIGGRADYFDNQRAAVVVYRHGPHIINVFSWASAGRSVPHDTTLNGYHFAFWQSGNLSYCAVSDTARGELMELVRLLREYDRE